ncbi:MULTISPECIES: hypothetical protein [unclassified Arthrobacter]|uniref:hypothetical protein n=1 Tax=unclassified Arthrobacter TaxID=235627 RepID=UPI001D14FCD9|nr:MULTISPECIES: hypothetical protein [unclassified Arthrobacter]MCC3275745.1 hypothetical protein [Arthrobacter sp. zg-Y20]MCC3278830.1 hypothetical protein [Arthrobacter sp. zg-Y40]MCC9177204.1 hypothetical protein [Arthrobacter sp. zg-Y750]MDK1315902.1 hypothetical protein [Arthrobacter sp. zg.Y20]MDK1326097.1 hypothetical protein [Arthrobacter sp. zg-Y1143]
MEDPLRVLVSVDTKNAAASIEVRGALTGSNCGTLLNILRHTATLGANILINLTRTAGIEDAALEVLADAAREVERAAPTVPALHVGVQLPPADAARAVLQPPPLSARQTLDNATALDMILARDPRVLPGPRPSRTGRNS